MRQYQVVVFGEDASDAARFRASMRSRFADLHIDEQLLRFLNEDSVMRRDPRAPAVGIYFGLAANNRSSSTELSQFMADGHVVIPVVPDLGRYSAFVPQDLIPINGYQLRAEDKDLVELCGIALENLSLLRKSRRVFISYRRAESQAVAIQLYEELDGRTFDVFLDTLAIRPGEQFQEVLWHRLADTDVMVLLDSPGFLESRWTEQELARANSTSIQVLQVIWPDHEQPAQAAFTLAHNLRKSDFRKTDALLGADAILEDAVVKEIALETESLRARALAARHAYLVQEMFREADSHGVKIRAQPGRYLDLSFPSGSRAIIVPTVGLPDAVRYQEIEEEIEEDETVEVLLVFDERGVRDRWLKHLGWLDPRMRVRSLRIGDVSSWMARRVSP